MMVLDLILCVNVMIDDTYVPNSRSALYRQIKDDKYLLCMSSIQLVDNP